MNRVAITPAGERTMLKLPEGAWFAAAEFIAGPLSVDPVRVSKPLAPPLQGQRSARVGEYRVLFTLHPLVDQAADESTGDYLITITAVRHRRDVYHR